MIDGTGATLSSARATYASDAPQQLGDAWNAALFDLLAALDPEVMARVVSLAIDGTSATTLLLDADTGALLQPPKLYNEAQAPAIVQQVKASDLAQCD